MLQAIDASAPNDVWAAGTGFDPEAETKRQLVLAHWNGTKWSKVAGLEIGSAGSWYDTNIYGIEVLAPDNVWLVGSLALEQNKTSTLILHWNGLALEVVEHPVTSGYKRELRAIVALAPNDLWAVGSLILHFDGQEWMSVAGPDGITLDNPQMPIADYGASLQGLAALAPDDIWAVGAWEMDTLIVHWNGKSWERVASPNYEFDPALTHIQLWDYLNDISARAADDIWAVGFATDNHMGGRAPSSIPLILHWDGHDWTTSQIGPNLNRGYSHIDGRLMAVAAISKNEVWVGSYGSLKRWDGQTWHHEPCPAKELGVYQLGWINDMAVVGGEAWTVGMAFYQQPPPDIYTNYESHTLVLDPADGPCPTPTPRPPTPTFTPPPTSVPPTWPPDVPTYIPTVPLPAPSGIVPVPTGVTP